MKAVILAGGLGTRLSEETDKLPKPMVEIGGRPIIWHIMKLFSAHGINDFVICCGYKGYMIKEYFANYWLHSSDVTFDMVTRQTEIHDDNSEPWRVTLVDTGEHTATGGRMKKIGEYLDDELFCMTYGDGLGNVDLSALLAFHRSHGKLATLTATRPPARFGALEFADDTKISRFLEKTTGDGDWINGGFFVLDRSVLTRIVDDDTAWEGSPLTGLAADGELQAFRHEGFWQPMDTLREKVYLNKLWNSDVAPWKVW